MKTHKPIHIFVDCHVFDGGFQGTRSYIKGLYTELIKDGSKHFYFAARDVRNLEAEFGQAANITYLQYRSESKVVRLLIETPLLILKHKIDFAHFQYRVPPVKLCRYIVTTHDVLFEDFPDLFPKWQRFTSYWSYKFSARISDIVFTVSPYSQNEIAKYLGVTHAIITPNGVDHLFFQKHDKFKIREEISREYGLTDYLIYISRREPRKNQHLLLRHFVDLKLYEQNQLLFIGHETFKNDDFNSILDGLSDKVKSRITVIDHVSFPKMVQLLRGAKASVYPSIAEGFGIPPLESVAAGIPTICSNHTAMADYDFFEDQFFNPEDQAEFKLKLEKIATEIPDEQRLKSLQETVKSRYNWGVAANIFNKTLIKLTDS